MADRHYSRQSPGHHEFMGPGPVLVIRDNRGTVVFGWSREIYRMDGQTGYCCTIFRNESDRKSSEVILECERIAASQWGPSRMFTYVDPSKIRSNNPGYCFKVAGWKFAGRSKTGLHLLIKQATGANVAALRAELDSSPKQ